MKTVPLYGALPYGLKHLTRNDLLTIAAGLAAAREHKADRAAVLSALGLSFTAREFGLALAHRTDLAETLCAALARLPRRRKGGAA